MNRDTASACLDWVNVGAATCGPRGSPFQSPARLAVGLGLESDLGRGCPWPCAPSSFFGRTSGAQSEEIGSPALALRKEGQLRLQLHDNTSHISAIRQPTRGGAIFRGACDLGPIDGFFAWTLKPRCSRRAGQPIGSVDVCCAPSMNALECLLPRRLEFLPDIVRLRRFGGPHLRCPCSAARIPAVRGRLPRRRGSRTLHCPCLRREVAISVA